MLLTLNVPTWYRSLVEGRVGQGRTRTQAKAVCSQRPYKSMLPEEEQS